MITKIYTEKFGLLSFIIKGVRSARSKPKASLLQPLTVLQMEINYRESRSLQFVKEFTREVNYHSLPFDVLKSALALFALEVITKTVREQEPNEEVFEFIYTVLLQLDAIEKPMPDFPVLFMLHLTRYLGFAPHDNYSANEPCFDLREGLFVPANHRSAYLLTGYESEQLQRLLHAPLYAPEPRLKQRSERQQMLASLIKFYRLHIENFNLNSPEILEEILH